MSKTITTNKLTRKVEIWQKTEEVNELGETTLRDKHIKSVFAAIIPQTGSISQRADTKFAKMTHKVIVRYGANKDLDASIHYIKYQGRVFDIMYILNPYEANKELELFCEEVIE